HPEADRGRGREPAPGALGHPLAEIDARVRGGGELVDRLAELALVLLDGFEQPLAGLDDLVRGQGAFLRVGSLSALAIRATAEGTPRVARAAAGATSAAPARCTSPAIASAAQSGIASASALTAAPISANQPPSPRPIARLPNIADCTVLEVRPWRSS